MAEYLSERELRKRRRELQKEEDAIRRQILGKRREEERNLLRQQVEERRLGRPMTGKDGNSTVLRVEDDGQIQEHTRPTVSDVPVARMDNIEDSDVEPVFEKRQREGRSDSELSLKDLGDMLEVEGDYDIERELQWLERRLDILNSSGSTSKEEDERKYVSGDNLLQDSVSVKEESTIKLRHTPERQGFSQLKYEIKTGNGDGTVDHDIEDRRGVLQPKHEMKTEVGDGVDDHDREERELVERIKRLRMRERLMEQEIKCQERIRSLQQKQERKQQEVGSEKRRMREKRIKALKEEEDALLRSVNEKQDDLKKLRQMDFHDREDLQGSDNKVSMSHIGTTQSETRGDIKPVIYKPKVPKLTETTFEEWRVEVNAMMDSGLYQEDILRQAVRNSLSGKTRKILLTLNSKATTPEIVEKLESVYGNVTSGETVLAEFYSAKQRKEESVSEWGVRLEGVIQKAIDKGHVKWTQKEEMLKTRFWRHLYSEELRNATRMYYETTDDFESLRRKVRMEESEIKTAKENTVPEKETIQTNVKQQTAKDEHLDLLKNLLDRMKRLEKELESRNGPSSNYDKSRQDVQRRGGNVGPRGRGQRFNTYRGNNGKTGNGRQTFYNKGSNRRQDSTDNQQGQNGRNQQDDKTNERKKNGNQESSRENQGKSGGASNPNLNH